jgi:hypothetical protein
MVFHNSPAPLFMVPRMGVTEVRLDLPRPARDVTDFAMLAQSCKHAVLRRIKTEHYEKVMFLDSDCVVLRNIDHFFKGDSELRVFPEPGTKIQDDSYCGYLGKAETRSLRREGMNSGTWVVAADRFGDLLTRWRKTELLRLRQKCHLREQSAFNRVVLDWDGKVSELPLGEIALPLCNRLLSHYRVYSNSAIVHAAGGDGVTFKLRFLFSTFMGAFLFDPQLAFFNIMEM